jgi:hypothetical protein
MERKNKRMTKQIIASELGLDPHYKVRIVLPGALLHLASKDEPRVTDWQAPEEQQWRGNGWVADWIDDHRYGDTIGFIDWNQVMAITWRWSP